MEAMKGYRLMIVRFMVMVLMSFGWTTGGFAITLDEAKANCWLAEGPNGYLAVATSSASQEVKALMKEINQKRRQKYLEISRKNRTKLEAVEALAGKTALNKTHSGHCIKLPSGEVKKK